MKTIIPTSDRVVIETVEHDEKAAGLQIIRDHKNIDMQEGRVIAAGPESPIKAGTNVLFNPAAGTVVKRLKEDGSWESLRMMHADTIQGIIVDA